MGGLPTSWLARLGALPPLRLGLAFVAAIGVSRAAAMLGAAAGAPGVAELGAVAAGAVWVLLWVVVVAHRREEDLLASGALLAMSLGGGGLLASALVTGVARRSVGEAAAMLLFGQFGAVLGMFFLVPVCTGALWLARRAAAAVGRASKRRATAA